MDKLGTRFAIERADAGNSCPNLSKHQVTPPRRPERYERERIVSSLFIWVTGQELSDYWNVEKIAKSRNDQELFNRLKIFRYCMYSTVLFFVLGFIIFLTNLVIIFA